MYMHTCEDYWELLVILKYSNSPLQSVDSVITAGNWYQCSIAQLPLLCKSIRVYVYAQQCSEWTVRALHRCPKDPHSETQSLCSYCNVVCLVFCKHWHSPSIVKYYSSLFSSRTSVYIVNYSPSPFLSLFSTPSPHTFSPPHTHTHSINSTQMTIMIF